MRSISAMFFNSACNTACLSVSINAATASCRLATNALSRKGWCNQRRSKRAPMAVFVVFNNEYNVGAASPRIVVSISKLRRVAASS